MNVWDEIPKFPVDYIWEHWIISLTTLDVWIRSLTVLGNITTEYNVLYNRMNYKEIGTRRL